MDLRGMTVRKPETRTFRVVCGPTIAPLVGRILELLPRFGEAYLGGLCAVLESRLERGRPGQPVLRLAEAARSRAEVCG